jgi:hypothetical protein
MREPSQRLHRIRRREHSANVFPLTLEEGLDAPTCFDCIEPANGQHSTVYEETHIFNLGCWPNT